MAPRRRRPRAPALDLSPERGVFVGRFTENGYRWVWSVDSAGRQLKLRTVYVGDAPGMTDELQAAIDELEADLDRCDPVPPTHPLPAFGRSSLRLI